MGVGLHRCGTCPACTALEALKPMHMPNPPFVSADDASVKTWHTDLIRHPCQQWNTEQLEAFYATFDNMSETIRPKAIYLQEERVRCGLL